MSQASTFILELKGFCASYVWVDEQIDTVILFHGTIHFLKQGWDRKLSNAGVSGPLDFHPILYVSASYIYVDISTSTC